MPPKRAELVLSHETIKMQTNLLSRGEDVVLREYFLTFASDATLSIHIMVTNRSYRSWVRIVPDRDMSVRPMFLFAQSLRTQLHFAFQPGKMATLQETEYYVR